MTWQPIWLSLQVAAASLFVVVTFGLAWAWALRRWDIPGKALLEALFTLPLVLPPVVTGFCLLLLLGRQGPLFWLFGDQAQLVFTPYAAVLAGAVVSFPLMYQNAKASLQSVDPHLEDAARTLGASELRVFFTISLPLAWPGVAAGCILSFARALGEFGATIMVAGNIPGKTQTLPLAIYFASEANDLTLAGLYVLLISGITFSMLFLLNRWQRRLQHKEVRSCSM